MELEELIVAWKKQDKQINQELKQVTFQHLIQHKSEGVLSRINKRLRLELLMIIFILVVFNVLFFIVDLPSSLVRWVCFAIFNMIGFISIYRYYMAVCLTILAYKEDLHTNLKQIIKSLHAFRNRNAYFNLPIGIICLCMFAGAQQLLYWLPWLIAEFLLWRWVLIPKMRARFDAYLVDLEYSLKDLQAMENEREE